MLERYGHGGDLRTAAESYGLSVNSFLDFSSNMNPLGPPNIIHDVLVNYVREIHNYPDPAVRGLRDKLSLLHQVDATSLLIGNGAAELIDLVIRALKPTSVTVAVPCFAEYADAARKQGAVVNELPLNSESGFVLDEKWVQHAIETSHGDVYMLGSPNNPTGRLVHPDLIMQLLESGAIVIIDEAFMDFVSEDKGVSLVERASTHHKLFVIRSMTKFYSISGIRLGYMVGHPDNMQVLRELQVPWSVNSLAQLIGEAVLDQQSFAIETMKWLQIERTWMITKLVGLGFEVCPSEANYLLLRLPASMNIDARQLQGELGRKGVLIRDASLFPGLDERYIRVAVKLRGQNEKLLSEFNKLLPTGV
ncbi:threonine-phosphate decarboxylase CobD [Paenibacillus sp. L3-i20]|uniref:threonine-phosphate decarboxylase CobD n=1 Tax=Paenibacillus sp. L3-i20 TaxID=2905833 RepID=UPI001EE0951E|nr:threonine-phosphate decarboxylase CobD [Paenibacillus sp. L3-i20]GKU78776.1 threonine-phosphate decarboxylase [Paenibacillus sp. L3-i20]